MPGNSTTTTIDSTTLHEKLIYRTHNGQLSSDDLEETILDFREVLEKSHFERAGPWQKKNVLCFDSGGVRGLSSLLILRELMDKISIHERTSEFKATSSADSPLIEANVTRSKSGEAVFLPCHYFDYIAGTSSGGMIAFMLSRWRMRVEDAIQEFEEYSSDLDQHQKRHKRHRKSSRDAPRTYKPEDTLLRSDSTKCRTIICSLQAKDSRGSKVPYLFTSYGHDQVPENLDPKFNLETRTETSRSGHSTHSLTSVNRVFQRKQSPPTPQQEIGLQQIWRATSLSPLYFDPVKMGGFKYYDATISISNPSREVFREVYDGDYGYPMTGNFISIGCGNSSRDAPYTFFQHNEKLGKVRRRLSKALSTSSEDVHSGMEKLQNASDDFSYSRFDALKDGLEGLHSSNVSMSHQIRYATQTYLKQVDVQTRLDGCARRLVALRQARCNTKRWEAFAIGSRYRCTHEDTTCDFQTKKRVVDRDDLLDHLRMDHDMPPPDSVHYQLINTLVESGKTNSD